MEFTKYLKFKYKEERIVNFASGIIKCDDTQLLLEGLYRVVSIDEVELINLLELALFLNINKETISACINILKKHLAIKIRSKAELMFQVKTEDFGFPVEDLERCQVLYSAVVAHYDNNFILEHYLNTHVEGLGTWFVDIKQTLSQPQYGGLDPIALTFPLFYRLEGILFLNQVNLRIHIDVAIETCNFILNSFPNSVSAQHRLERLKKIKQETGMTTLRYAPIEKDERPSSSN